MTLTELTDKIDLLLKSETHGYILGVGESIEKGEECPTIEVHLEINKKTIFISAESPEIILIRLMYHFSRPEYLELMRQSIRDRKPMTLTDLRNEVREILKSKSQPNHFEIKQEVRKKGYSPVITISVMGEKTRGVFVKGKSPEVVLQKLRAHYEKN